MENRLPKGWTPADLFANGGSGMWRDESGIGHYYGNARPPEPVAHVNGMAVTLTHEPVSPARLFVSDFALSDDEMELVETWVSHN